MVAIWKNILHLNLVIIESYVTEVPKRSEKTAWKLEVYFANILNACLFPDRSFSALQE